MASEPAAPDWYSHGLNRVASYRLATGGAAALPRSVRLRLARGLGRLLARALPAERRAVRSNLGRVLAGASPAVIDARVRETFANFGAFFANLLTLNRRPGAALRDYVASAEGEHHLDAAIAAGRGVVLLTAHLGNWEFAGRLLSSRGGRTAHVVLSAEPAAFLPGPFVLARAAGAAVVPAFCAMAPGGRYRLEIEPPIWVKPGEELAGLATVVAALERVIRAYPTQWFNFFDAWSPPDGHA